MICPDEGMQIQFRRKGNPCWQDATISTVWAYDGITMIDVKHGELHLGIIIPSFGDEWRAA